MGVLEAIFGILDPDPGELLAVGITPFLNMSLNISTSAMNSATTLARLTPARAGYLDNINNPYLGTIPNLAILYTSFLTPIVNVLTTGGDIYEWLYKIAIPFNITTEKLNHLKDMLEDMEGAVKTNFYRLVKEFWDEVVTIV
jgi:hypothetical protein